MFFHGQRKFKGKIRSIMNLINCKIRPNVDETSKALFGWGEVLDNDSGMHYNNIKLKIKRLDDGGVKVVLDFPSKTAVMQNGMEKKIFFVKPIRADTYREFERVFIHAIRLAVEEKRNGKEN